LEFTLDDYNAVRYEELGLICERENQMSKYSVLALFLGVSAVAGTTPVTDIYSDSLTINKSAAEIPQSLDAAPGTAVAVKEFDPELDGQESSDAAAIVKAAKPAPKKSARKKK
jgi:hypothetical protein